MYGELVPQGGGDPIPLLKKSLLVGRRESCDIVLRFSNVSAHHCQLTVSRRLLVRSRPEEPQRREGQRDSRDGQAARSGRHPVDRQAQVRGALLAGRLGRGRAAARRTNPSQDIFGKSLLERAGLKKEPRVAKPTRPKPRHEGSVRYDITNDEPGQLRIRNHRPLVDHPHGEEEEAGPSFARKNRAARTRPTDWTQQFHEHGFEEDAPAARRADQRQGRPHPPPHRLRHRGRHGRRAGLRRPSRRRRDRLPAGPRALRARADQHRRGRRRHALPVRHAAAAEDADHRSAPRRGRRRPRAVSARPKTPTTACARASSSGSSRATAASAARAAAGSRSSSPTSIRP